MSFDEKSQTALGDACTSAANATAALERLREKMVEAHLSAQSVDPLIDDVRRLAAALGDEYVRREGARHG